MLKLINLLHEALVAEATQFKYQGKTLKMVLIPNTNPTKQGIRIQIIGDFKDLNNSEKDALQVELLIIGDIKISKKINKSYYDDSQSRNYTNNSFARNISFGGY